MFLKRKLKEKHNDYNNKMKNGLGNKENHKFNALTLRTLKENYLFSFVRGNSIKLYTNFHYFCKIICA